MITYTVGELKRHFSALLDKVRNGERIVVEYGRSREKVAVILPYSSVAPKRQLGLLEGKAKCHIAQDFELNDEDFLAS